MSEHEWADEYLRRANAERDAIRVPRRRRRGWPGLPAEPPPDPEERFRPATPYLRGRSLMRDGRPCWVAVCWECAHVTRWPAELDDLEGSRSTPDPDLLHQCDREPDLAGLRALAAHDIRAAGHVMGLDDVPTTRHTEKGEPR